MSDDLEYDKLKEVVVMEFAEKNGRLPNEEEFDKALDNTLRLLDLEYGYAGE